MIRISAYQGPCTDNFDDNLEKAWFLSFLAFLGVFASLRLCVRSFTFWFWLGQVRKVYTSTFITDRIVPEPVE